MRDVGFKFMTKIARNQSPFPLLVACLLLLPGCSKDQQPIRSAGVAVIQTALGNDMSLVTGGTFVMGDAEGEADETPREVSVDSFYMDKLPVTQEMYERITGRNPSKRLSPNQPVERMQWTDAAQFCNKCSEMEGLTPCYDVETWKCNFDANGYRLPTEAEWEYACRAGSPDRYFFGEDGIALPKYAWFKQNSKGRPRPVAQKLPNRWGLHDMLGNVWEWCNDYYDENYYRQGETDNPRGPSAGKKRVLRGGAWSSTAERCRPAVRFSEFQVFTDACFGADTYGFRRVKGVTGGAVLLGSATAKSTIEPADQAGETVSQVDEAISRGAVAESVKASETATGSMERIVASKIDPSRLVGQIAFVSDRGGKLDIWKMTAQGADLRRLTNDEFTNADPRFSPSGEQIMYTTLRDGFPQVWTMRTDGSNPQHVTEGSQAAWSPDGDSIVFIRDDQAFVRNLSTANEKLVTPPNWRRCGVPAWAPNGNQLAVASRHLERIGIFIFGMEGSAHQQLITEDGCCTPQWSSDGTQIVFQTDKGHIHLHYFDDDVEEQVTFGADVQHDARFSPDGSMIVYCRAPSEEGPWQLWVTDLQDEELTSVQLTSVGSNRLPDWHSVGEVLSP